MEKSLQDIRDWAKAKIASGQEAPWAWFQYMKLVETVEAILVGMAATKEHSQQSAQHQGKHLRLVEGTSSLDTALPHPETMPVSLPM